MSETVVSHGLVSRTLGRTSCRTFPHGLLEAAGHEADASTVLAIPACASGSFWLRTHHPSPAPSACDRTTAKLHTIIIM